MTKQDLKLLLIVCAVIAAIVGGFLLFALLANSSYTPGEKAIEPIEPMVFGEKELSIKRVKDKIQKEGIVTPNEWRNQTPGLLLKEAERITWSEFLKRYQNKKFHLIIRDLNKK